MTDYLKKYLLFIVLFCILIFTLLLILLFNKTNNNIISNDNNIVNNTNNGMFAIMLETEAGSGEYQESTSSTWPGEGYIFNENLSTCENGSELSWNEELGAVNLKTNIADKCFVYFDVYIPNIFYKYDASLNNDLINNGMLLGNIESITDDEILLIFDNYQGELFSDGRTLSKRGNTSFREYSLNYGLNSVIYLNDSDVYLSANPNIESYSNYSPIFYLKNSNLSAQDVYINNHQNTNDILAILNNSGINISNTSITSVNDLYVYINGTSNDFNVNSILYEVNGEEKPLNFILNETSCLTLTNNASFNSNITLNKSSNVVINNMGSMTVNAELDESSIEITNSGNMTVKLDSDVSSTALIHNNSNMDCCFNPNSNVNFNINLENTGAFSLTCDSYVSGFENYTELDNINSNGYNIYYDSSKSTTLSGTMDFVGGGQLIPY